LPEHLGANFHQVRTDGCGRRDRIAGQQGIGDLAMIILILAPADRVGVALLQLEPRALVAESDDRLIDGDRQAVSRYTEIRYGQRSLPLDGKQTTIEAGKKLQDILKVYEVVLEAIPAGELDAAIIAMKKGGRKGKRKAA
jgi:hypothetical protein